MLFIDLSFYFFIPTLDYVKYIGLNYKLFFIFTYFFDSTYINNINYILLLIIDYNLTAFILNTSSFCVLYQNNFYFFF